MLVTRAANKGVFCSNRRASWPPSMSYWVVRLSLARSAQCELRLSAAAHPRRS